MLRNTFRPGDPVPEAHYFWVHHYQHRMPHLCEILFQYFPGCSTCGERIRFEAAHTDVAEATLLREDHDFKHAVGQIPFKADAAAAADL